MGRIESCGRWPGAPPPHWSGPAPYAKGPFENPRFLDRSCDRSICRLITERNRGSSVHSVHSKQDGIVVDSRISHVRKAEMTSIDNFSKCDPTAVQACSGGEWP